MKDIELTTPEKVVDIDLLHDELKAVPGVIASSINTDLQCSIKKIVLHAEDDGSEIVLRKEAMKVLEKHQPRVKRTLADALKATKTQEEKMALIEKAITKMFGNLEVEA